MLGVDHSTGEALLGTVLRQDPGGPDRETFPRRVRLCETDDAGYNDRCERGLLALRRGWTRLRFPCEVHFDAGTHTRVYGFSGISQDISGMVRTTLAKNAFGMIITFREAARKVLPKLLRVVDSVELDAAALAYKDLVLDTFVGNDPADLVVRETLKRLLPGDWRTPGELVWVRVAGETDAQIIEIWSSSLVPLFWGRAPFEFPRNRWTGSPKTFRDIGLPCCVNNIEFEVFREFRAALGESTELPPGVAAPGHAPLVGAGGGDDADGAPADAEALVVPLEADGVLAALEGPRASPNYEDMPTQNKGYRTLSFHWLATSPGILRRMDVSLVRTYALILCCIFGLTV